MNYSTDIQFLNQLTGRLSIPGCTNTQGQHVKEIIKSTPMTHIVCKAKIRTVVRSSMHLYLGHWVTIKRAVVYHARSAHAFSAGIKCRHCTYVKLVYTKGRMNISRTHTLVKVRRESFRPFHFCGEFLD